VPLEEGQSRWIVAVPLARVLVVMRVLVSADVGVGVGVVEEADGVLLWERPAPTPAPTDITTTTIATITIIQNVFFLRPYIVLGWAFSCVTVPFVSPCV
jgi:hypothetical protein